MPKFTNLNIPHSAAERLAAQEKYAKQRGVENVTPPPIADVSREEMRARVAEVLWANLGCPGAFNINDQYRRITTIQLSSADFLGMAEAALSAIMPGWHG